VPLLRFGGGWLLAVMAVMFLVNIEKLLLVRMVSVQTLAYYSIAFTFANTATFLPQAMTQTLLPAFSRLKSLGQSKSVQDLFRRGMRYSLLIELPGLMVMAVAARPLFRFWAGTEFEINSTLPFYILLVGLFFNILASVPHSAIVAAGRTELLARLYWLQLLIYPPGAALLIYRFGIAGAATAWSVRAIVDAILINIIAYRVAGVRAGFGDQILKVGLPTLLLAAGLAFAILYDNFSGWVLLTTTVSVVGYCWLLWVIGLESDEKAWAKNRSGRLLSLLFRTRRSQASESAVG
jgi:O-antigen/teichoic acid export membrane protein